MELPRPSAQLMETFRRALPAAPDVEEKKMFGQLAAFVNGNMFGGLFGESVQVRLDEAGRSEALVAGAEPFAPMGRPMREYMLLPQSIVDEPDGLSAWLARGYAYASGLPKKAPKDRKNSAEVRRN